jgi:uncharacterized membrane protein
LTKLQTDLAESFILISYKSGCRGIEVSLESNKTLGGVGAILLAIPFLNLIGIILVLIAMKGMTDYYKDEDIFRNALYGFIFGFVGVVALIAVILMLVLGSATFSPVITTSPTTAPFVGVSLFLIAFIILYVFSLIGAIFYKKSLDILSNKSGERMFNTAGLILLIGAAIPLLGEILKFVAWILAAVGFFNIRASTQLLTPTPAISASEEMRFCRHCGAPVPSDAAFCPKCGNKID